MAQPLNTAQFTVLKLIFLCFVHVIPIVVFTHRDATESVPYSGCMLETATIRRFFENLLCQITTQ